MKTPKPTDLSNVKVFWEPEAFDEFIPQDGWLWDYTLSLRGIETPTPFAIWSGLYTLSALAKRDSWFHWLVDLPLYPNLYVLVVGPPKTGKTTAISISELIIQRLQNEIKDPFFSRRKELNFFRGKVTPEAFSFALQPKDKTFRTEDGKLKPFKTDSEVCLFVGELGSLLGKQTYNEGLITRLTDLYDCRDRGDEMTVGRGKMEWKNIYVTLFGATTPTALQETIPEQAFGGGFLSRVIIASSERTRSRPYPRKVEGAPDWDGLAKRLAWCLEKAPGEYTFSKEADNAYRQWYSRLDRMLRRKKEARHSEVYSRYDIHILKLSLLFRLQRYQKGRRIELEDFNNARNLLEATSGEVEATLENIGTPFYTQMYNRIYRHLEKVKKRTRRSILTTYSKYGLTSPLLDEIISQLVQEDRLHIRLDGKTTYYPSHHGRELYVMGGKE